MSTWTSFRSVFWIIFAGMILLQAYYSYQDRSAVKHLASECTAVKHEGRGCAITRAIRSLTLIVFLALYAFIPPWIDLFAVPFPDWIRWLGVLLGGLSLAIYAWSRATLGKEWSSQLQMHAQHHLVTSGPYTWIRHPIYLALLCFLTSIALIAANWVLIAILVFSIVDLTLRIPKEEQMMIEEFGDEYKIYMQRTGRLLPK